MGRNVITQQRKPRRSKRGRKALEALEIGLRYPSILRPKQHLFLLSHVRAYTTVISHILGSHPEISGYAETWSSYEHHVDLLKLRYSVCKHGNYKPRSRYLFDKVLHNRLVVADTIFRRQDVWCIIMVREPVATLKSMVALYRKYIREGGSAVGCTLPATVHDAGQQYAARLRVLTSIGDRLCRYGRSFFMIDGSEIMHNAESMLTKLSSFLRLNSPLKPEYQLFDRSGQWDFGDTSEFIKRGRIVRDRSGHEDIVLPSSVLDKAVEQYQHCIASLRACSSVMLHVVFVCTATVAHLINRGACC